jgi:uncharacterized membrane protein YfcA
LILEPVAIALLVTLVGASAIINGLAGFGFALLALNALALVLDTKDGVIVMSLLAPLMSGLQLLRHRYRLGVTRRLGPMIGGALAGSLIGTQLLILLPTPWVSIALGAFTLWFVASSLREERAPLAGQTQRWLGPVAGVIGGITNGALGASGPIFGTYLAAIGLRGADFAVAISIAFFTMGVLRVGLLGLLDQYESALVLLAVVLAVPAIGLQRIGFYYQGRLPRATVFRVVLIVLLVGGLNLIWRGIMNL